MMRSKKKTDRLRSDVMYGRTERIHSNKYEKARENFLRMPYTTKGDNTNDDKRRISQQ